MVRQKLGRGQPDGTPVGIVLVDLDYFKVINNNYGPQAGDAVLREAARRIRSQVRLYDSVGRCGGAEFLVVVPGCYLSEIVQEAEKICAAVNGEAMDVLGRPISVTASVGVATTEECRNRDPDSLLRAADAAVRRAKDAGRNCVLAATAADLEEVAAK